MGFALEVFRGKIAHFLPLECRVLSMLLEERFNGALSLIHTDTQVQRNRHIMFCVF
jgi:hypothetical protein